MCLQGSDCDENMNKACDKVVRDEAPNQGAKTCADCGTTKTPLWRGGPAGPKVPDLTVLIFLCLIFV